VSAWSQRLAEWTGRALAAAVFPIMIRTERGRAFMHLAFFNDGGSHNVALKQMMVAWAKRKRGRR
jgi:hypothetical protein